MPYIRHRLTILNWIVSLCCCSNLTGDGFGSSHARNLLSADKVAELIILPTGCLEQTMIKLAPTASAIRYLDLSDQWVNLPTGSRDKALDHLENGRYFSVCFIGRSQQVKVNATDFCISGQIR